MNWRDILFSKSERKAIGTIVQPMGIQGRPAELATDRASLMRTSSRNELVWACIEIKRKAMQDPRLVVEQRGRDGAWQEDAGHPFRRLMMRPHPKYDEAAFMGLFVASVDICGKFFAEKLRNGAKGLIGLNPLNPAYLKPRTENGDLVGYTWQRGREKVEFDLDELLIYEHPNWSGASPLQVALGSVDADSAQTDYIRAFFGNAGVPSGVLTTEQELSVEQGDALRARWRALFGRSGNRHDIAVLGKGATYNRTGANLDELDSETVRGVTESRICMVFGVPPLIVYAYVGLTRATYSNLKEAWASFWDSELSTALKAYRSFFTWFLLTEFESEDLIYGERIRLRWDLSQVAALQDDVDALHKRAEAAFRAGGMTLNEYRSQIGQAPDKAGDYYLRSLAQISVPAGDVPETETRSAAAPTAVKALKVASTQTVEQRIQKRIQALAKQTWNDLADLVEAEGA